ncbi:TPA: hypothetical protein IOG99_001372 [Salmonella enterica]|uniref:hypothetical protein n=1 Tax=Salmonella enterica TaxID=28901 RepID=UPI00133139F1|nr:hypothetical protein [Salmonella enterica]EGI6578362.1 hypothetical protein [Salmonella enterica subsp. enterica serovar Typhimurium]EHG5371709.1 hypothetical protein [Salmonella enterica subsp. enterica serovar Paratyphi A]HCG3911689.1 hypothetical protein [Salmonella enterica subsp. enterica serovar Typhi str. AG3]HCK5903199.1 hypothetical protein [Salmonella enterica subsp. enterica serovar Typhi str. CT18]EEC2531668.1 hypothetical protein [Salmonella enterica]
MQRYPSDASGDYRYLICIFIAESMENMVHPGGLLALRLALRAVADATLSFLVPAVITAILSASLSLKVWRIWCIREDSNLRPLGS